MKFTFFVSFLICFGFIFSQNTEVRTVNIDGTVRTYRLYVPSIYNGNQAVPLVLNFHGYTSSAFEQENYGDFRPIADTANFILVHPEGLNGGTGNFWNSFSTVDMSNYDYQFVSRLIDSLKIEFAIDEARIYSTGLSNGGFFSYDLACFMNEKFAAIASVSGSMISQHENLCNPTRKVPVMQIHGTADQVVTYSGTGGIIACVGAEALVSSWVERNECSTVPSITNLPNSNTTDNSTVTHYVYEGANTSVEFYKITAGGHTWPGASFTVVGQNTNQDFSASKEIWRFFNQYSLNQISASTNELHEKNITFFPNPVSNEFTIKINGQKNDDIKIYDNLGELIFENKVENTEFFSVNTQLFEPGIYFVKVGEVVMKFLVDSK